MKTKTTSLAVLAAISAITTSALADKLTIDGSTTVGPIAKAVAEAYMKENKDAEITVSESGSGNGAKALLNSTCDIAALSRPLKDTEEAAMREKGVNPVKKVVAYDAICIVVHPSNRVKELTKEQLKKIYTGEITNWKEVGGFDTPILVISREANSGTAETFKEMVLGEGKVVDAAEFAGSNGAVRQRVAGTRGAIAYTGLGFIDRTVKALAVETVAPSSETVIANKYPLSRELLMFTNGAPAADSLAAKFYAAIDSDNGRKMIDELGFVAVPKE